MQQAFGWCFIGCGRLAKQVADQLAASGAHRVVSVYARNAEKTEAFATQYGAAACKSAAEAMTWPGVEGVYIVTPHNSHFAYAKLALTLNRPVLCEKAFTVDAAEARELAALAREKRLYLAEAMWTWFSPVAQRVKRWIDAGELGQMQTASICCHQNSVGYAPRVTDPNAAGGALLDMGVYAVTYLYRLFGMPSKVRCTGTLSDGIDWGEEIELRFPSGLCGTASVSIRDANGGRKLLLQGTRATVEVPEFNCAQTAWLRRADGTEERATGDGGYQNEFDLTAAEIRQGLTESRFVPLQATVDVMEILQECRAQMGLRYPFETAAEAKQQEGLDESFDRG